MSEGSRHPAVKVYRFRANPGVRGKGAGPGGEARSRLRSRLLSRRSGRTSALPYPPPRSSSVVIVRGPSSNHPFLLACLLAASACFFKLAIPLGEDHLFQAGQLVSLSGDDVKDVLNALKMPDLEGFLGQLPAASVAVGDALSLFLLNAEISWALAAPDSFTNALTNPTDFASAAANWKLPRPMDALVANLFGAVDPVAVAPPPPPAPEPVAASRPAL